MLVFSQNTPRLFSASNNAQLSGSAAAMRQLAREKATGLLVPAQRRLLSSASRWNAQQRNNNSKKQTRKPRPPYSPYYPSSPSSSNYKGPSPPKSSTIDARLEDQGRVESVSHGHDPKTRIRMALNEHTGRHDKFRKTVLSCFQVVLTELQNADYSVIGLNHDELNRQANLFMNAIDDAFLLAQRNISARAKNPLFWNLREAFIMRDNKGVTNEIRYAFQSFMVRNRFSKGLETNQQRLLDLRFPQEWFPSTREVQRTIHVHVGPTNSGKTYNALKALQNSKSGVYAGPLRLLANEIYQRFTNQGIPCALLTGEEVRIPEHTDHYFHSCTVEMIPLNIKFDVAIIDEIQLIGDAERGNAWTNALLGVQAKEVHVCGEERAVKLVQSLSASIGDKCVVHRYQRLSPLESMDKSIDNDFSKLQKGDAIVAFSRVSLHALKRNIEKKTGRRCAIIYGSLPPEVRVQQASLFNEPDNDYDFVVASDAIGMGLNLEIKRVILDAVTKYDGSRDRPLTFPEIKQIGGRAGRYRTATNPDGTNQGADGSDVAASKVGYVTTMEYADLPSIQSAFKEEVDDLKVAYVTPPAAVVERFAAYYPPSTPLSFLLMRIRAAAIMGDLFRILINSDSLEIADTIQDLPMPIQDRLTLCFMPVNLRTPSSKKMLRALAKIISTNGVGDLLSIKEAPLENLDIDMRDTKNRAQEYLHKMEDLHMALNQYIWLSYRYSGIFRNRGLAFHIRTLVEERLTNILDRLDFTEKDIEARRRLERKRAQKVKVDIESLDATPAEEEEKRAPADDDDWMMEPSPEGDPKLLEVVEASRDASYSRQAHTSN